ncbi:MAG TPA: PEP-CTERM sorting domain-containing protein [Pyrinomonadaceae bacterium]|nr:PEP-CTERM sorting domain-containing protein [Pyrinomonadaceae bacterium]
MRIRTKLVMLVGLMFLGLYAPSVRADNVVLTSGSVTTLANVGTVNLTGLNFSLNYAGDIPGGPSFGINSVSLSLGNPSVTFNGVTSAFFRGSLSFTNSSISGTVTAFNSMEDQFFNTNPIFSVTFSGSGFITITNLGAVTQTQFTVTPTSVPEPATLLQLFAGLTSGGAILFRRRYAKPPLS